MPKFIRLLICKFVVEIRKVQSERTQVHVNVNLPCAALRVIGWEVRKGKLSPGRLSYHSLSDTAWYSEEYQPRRYENILIVRNMSHTVIILWVSWRCDVDMKRAKERQHGVFFFPLKTMTNHAFVEKKPQRKVYITLQREKLWCW
jgi:hypothetical protein